MGGEERRGTHCIPFHSNSGPVVLRLTARNGEKETQTQIRREGWRTREMRGGKAKLRHKLRGVRAISPGLVNKAIKMCVITFKAGVMGC